MIRTGYDLLEYAMVITFVVIAIVAIIPAGTGDNVIAVLEQLGAGNEYRFCLQKAEADPQQVATCRTLYSQRIAEIQARQKK